MTNHEITSPRSGEPNPRILLVDDDLQLIQVFAAWLDDEGFDVDLAFDGLQALDSIAEIEPDLVVADVSMPRMDGITLASQLQKRRIPVVLISANPLPASADPAIPFLRKPFDLALFVRAVRQHLRSGARSRTTK